MKDEVKRVLSMSPTVKMTSELLGRAGAFFGMRGDAAGRSHFILCPSSFIILH